jgi:drug/metabolite transporter (DMT)-like permease
MLLGFVYIVLASIAFGFSPVFSKEIMKSGMDAQSTLAFVNATAALGALPFLLVRRKKLKVSKKQLWQLLIFGGCSYGLTELLLIYSYKYLPIGLAVMFHFIYPIVVTVVMVVLYREKVSVVKIAAILAALIGLYLILDLSGSLSLRGVILAMSSGFAYAVYVVANRKCAYRELPPLMIVLITMLFCALGFGLYQFAEGGLTFPTTSKTWLMVAASSLFSHLFALNMLICAVRRIGASNAAIGNMLEPLTSLLAGVVIYGDRLPLISFGGCALMLLAILLITIDEKKSLSQGR